MNMNRHYVCVCVLCLLAPGILFAQDSDYHPILSDNFTASLGAMKSSNSFKAEAGAPGDPGDEIDFDDSLGVSNSSTFFNGQLRWKFGKTKKWSLSGQYFSNKATGSAVLTEDVDFDGLTFREGSFAEAGVKLAVARVFVGRSFFKNEKNDFGLGIGIHNLDLDLFLEAELKVNDMTTGVQRAGVGASQLLPNIGGWYYFSPAQKWLLHARVDWLNASIGDYSGVLWNITAGINYQAFRNVGFDLYWQYFNLNVDVDKSDWVGSANMIYSGPVLAATFNW